LTTSPTPGVWVPRHVARLVTRLVVDYSASRRLLVDYFASATRPGASARRAARRRLLRLRRASGCLGTSRGASLVVDYFAYAVRPGASARRAARHEAHRRLLRALRLRLAATLALFSHAVRRDYLSRGNTGSTLSTPHAATMSSFGRIASTIHLD
jgi:hypothetical protein